MGMGNSKVPSPQWPIGYLAEVGGFIGGAN
jgi:hypothetical protein